MNSSAVSQQPHDGPIRIGTTTDSRERFWTAVLVFQRWCEQSRTNHTSIIPQGLAEGLRNFLLEPDLPNFQLDDRFHLYKQAQHDSSRSIQIFEFTATTTERNDNDNDINDADEIVTVRYVRKSDNDIHTLRVRSGEVHCSEGHWMSGTHESTDTFFLPTAARGVEARGLLHEHWVAPRKWLREGRAILVRPSDVDSSAFHNYDGEGCECFPRVHGVVLCEASVRALAQGFTLLLVTGDLIRVDLPPNKRGNGQRNVSMFMLFAGMMWKEGKPQQEAWTTSEHEANNDAPPTRHRSTGPRRPDELAFIIAEKAARHGFTGTQADSDANHGGKFFMGNTYRWKYHDVFKYIPGEWH